MINQFFCTDNKLALKYLIKRNLKVRYRGSVLGFLWTALIPALNAVVFFIVFTHFIGGRSEHFAFLLIAALSLWSFFTQASTNSLESLVGNQSLLGKVPLNFLAFPLSENLSAAINLSASVPFIIIVGVLSGITVTAYTLILFLWLFIFAINTYAISIILSISFVYLRDLRHFMTLVNQILFYLSPIVYDGSKVENRFIVLKYINPLWFLINNIKLSLLGKQSFEIFGFLTAISWTIVLWAIAVSLYRSKRFELVEKI